MRHALILLLFASSAAAEPFTIHTSDGVLKLGAISQFDGRFFVGDTTPTQIDQFAFRTLRLDVQATLLDHFDVHLLPDFAGGKLVVQDAYVDVRYASEVKLRFGKFKVPFGIERLQAEVATVFAERGLPTQLVPNRDLGVQVFGDVVRGAVAYQLGVFDGVADGASTDGDVSNPKEVAARVIVQPFVNCDTIGKHLAFGVAGTYGDKVGTVAQSDVPTWRTQGGSTILAYKAGTTLADTVTADGTQLRASAQGTWYVGPFGVLAEYVRSSQKLVSNGTHVDAHADAWQVVGQWVVTGDDATYASVTPKHPLDPGNGEWGAVDVVARIGELRLADGQVFDAGLADASKSARRAWSAGAGADWFATRNFRVVLDVERTWFRLGGAMVTDRAPETSIIGRVQTAF